MKNVIELPSGKQEAQILLDAFECLITRKYNEGHPSSILCDTTAKENYYKCLTLLYANFRIQCHEKKLIL